MRYRELFCFNHDPEVIDDPYPYPHGIDTPFSIDNTGWNRAWEIPVRCRKCGHEYTKHVSAPKLLSRRVEFYWAAPESKISLAKSITKKLRALDENQLIELNLALKNINLSCGVCEFKTKDPNELQAHIWNNHLGILKTDVLNTYLRRSLGSEKP